MISEILSLLPLGLGFSARYFLKDEMREQAEKALAAAGFLYAVVSGLELPFIIFYTALTALVYSKTRAVYTAVFGGILTSFAYLSANNIFAVIPLTTAGLASALSYILNRLSGRSSKGFVWSIYMFLISSAASAYLLVSLGCYNPFWGLLAGLIATWADYTNPDFSVPYTVLPLGLVLGQAQGILMGFGISLIFSSFAYYLHALDFGGMVGGILTGTLVFSSSPVLFTAMLAFLFSSTLLGRAARHDERFQKKGMRTSAQVLVNGFWPALASILIAGGQNFLGIGLAAVAASTADTWATEVGSQSRRRPRLITNLKFVEPGRSGGITPLGLFASLLGGVFIFLISMLFNGVEFLAPILVAAVVGSVVDSLLGASAQGLYKCRLCNRTTEGAAHCGKSSVLERGIWWLNNDMVNLASALVAAVIVL